MGSDWGHIGPCPEPLAYIQSAGRSHASSIGGFENLFFDHKGPLAHLETLLRARRTRAVRASVRHAPWSSEVGLALMAHQGTGFWGAGIRIRFLIVGRQT